MDANLVNFHRRFHSRRPVFRSFRETKLTSLERRFVEKLLRLQSGQHSLATVRLYSITSQPLRNFWRETATLSYIT